MLASGLLGRGNIDCEKGQVDLQLWTVGNNYESSVTKGTVSWK